jgi:hypothetical protein
MNKKKRGKIASQAYAKDKGSEIPYKKKNTGKYCEKFYTILTLNV